MPVLPAEAERSATLHIQSVSRLTNLSVDTIRAWEKRYSAVKPKRGPTGQRRFSSDDVARLVLLKEAVDGGESISRVAALSTSRLRCLVQRERTVGDADDATILRLLRCVYTLDVAALADELASAGLSRPAVEFADDIIAPLMIEIGANARTRQEAMTWETILCSTVHSISSTISAKYAVSNQRPMIVFLTLFGEKHSLPPLLASFVAAEGGFRSFFAGTEVAPYNVESIAHALRAAALGIYVGMCTDDAIRLVREVRARVSGIPVFVGSQSARLCSALDATETLRAFAARLTRFAAR